MRAKFINEESLNIDLLIKELRLYTNYEGEWKAEKKLDDIFKNLNIDKLKNTYPKIFDIPNKYKKPNVYYFRGDSLPISDIKKLGEYDEIYNVPDVGKSLIWNDRKIEFRRNITSFTLSPLVANHFAESSSSWNLPPYDLNFDIPVIYHVEYNNPDFFMNPDWIGEISYINEQELFFKNKTCIGDISIFIDKNMKKLYNL